MDRRLSDTVVAVLSLALCVAGQDANCPPPCPPCPTSLTCPAPSCPPPVCPPLPTVPPCPAARCPTLPEVPPCPTPQVALACPDACPSCPSCPPCPDACPPCGTPPTSSTSRPPIRVPAGYQIRPGIGAYKYFQTGRSWQSANSTCGEDGGYLVVPKNRDELLMLLGMMTQTFLHVGFHDTIDEGNWITALGQPMSAEQVQMWKPGEPSSGGTADCAFLSGGSNLMLDGNCNDPEPFVCEIQL